METTADIPIFPLQTVLYPSGRLPLRIFEARYVDMTKVCIRDDSVFGVCLIQAGQEVGAPAQHAEIGCTARIVNWEVPHAGLFTLVTVGESVFRVLERRVEADGLIRARVRYEPPAAAAPLPDGQRELSALLRTLIERIGPEHFAAPLRYDDARWVSQRMAELLPLSAGQKLRLLEDGDPLVLLDEIGRLAKMIGLWPSA